MSGVCLHLVTVKAPETVAHLLATCLARCRPTPHLSGIVKSKHDNLQTQQKLLVSSDGAGELVGEPGSAGEPGPSLAASKCQHLLEELPDGFQRRGCN